jgi:hypothetical protein
MDRDRVMATVERFIRDADIPRGRGDFVEIREAIAKYENHADYIIREINEEPECAEENWRFYNDIQYKIMFLESYAQYLLENN